MTVVSTAFILFYIECAFIIMWVRETNTAQKLASPLVYSFFMLLMSTFDQTFATFFPGAGPAFWSISVLLMSWSTLTICTILLNSTHVNALPKTTKLGFSMGYALMIFVHVIKFYR